MLDKYIRYAEHCIVGKESSPESILFFKKLSGAVVHAHEIYAMVYEWEHGHEHDDYDHPEHPEHHIKRSKQDHAAGMMNGAMPVRV